MLGILWRITVTVAAEGRRLRSGKAGVGEGGEAVGGRACGAAGESLYIENQPPNPAKLKVKNGKIIRIGH